MEIAVLIYTNEESFKKALIGAFTRYFIDMFFIFSSVESAEKWIHERREVKDTFKVESVYNGGNCRLISYDDRISDKKEYCLLYGTKTIE